MSYLSEIVDNITEDKLNSARMGETSILKEQEWLKISCLIDLLYTVVLHLAIFHPQDKMFNVK